MNIQEKFQPQIKNTNTSKEFLLKYENKMTGKGALLGRESWVIGGLIVANELITI